MFTLRFNPSRLQEFAGRYEYPTEDRIVNKIAPRVRAAGCYNKSQFLEVCAWKTPRSKRHCRKNSEDFVVEVTRLALSNQHERIRIEVLTLLSGVDWPTASVLLHFGYDDLYPILDFRALWSVGVSAPPVYSSELWWRYVLFCRNAALKYGVSMRNLDRALWQYSKEHQKT